MDYHLVGPQVNIIGDRTFESIEYDETSLDESFNTLFKNL